MKVHIDECMINEILSPLSLPCSVLGLRERERVLILLLKSQFLDGMRSRL